MKIMISYEMTEDYIVNADSVEDAIKKVSEIFEHKQSSQKDLLWQEKVDYHCEINKKYEIEE
jgi:hypothetical protein|tara:strand:+ start:4029 stop:4214 length:186 start_codon:yes stop_codon:yes gene_type:complete